MTSSTMESRTVDTVPQVQGTKPLRQVMVLPSGELVELASAPTPSKSGLPYVVENLLVIKLR